MPLATPFRSFWFDCDSTLSAIEGVDELTHVCLPAVRKEIERLTRAAMNGELPLAEVYERRLHTLAPTRSALMQVGRLYVERLVPDARETILALHFLGKDVGIVSGGLLPVVRMLAAELGVHESRVHAVDVRFDSEGRYQDFDRTSPFWRNGGKRAFFGGLQRDARPVVFVGDGATDLEAQDRVELFVGFGGVVVREPVKRAARAFVMSFPELLELTLTTTELALLRDNPKFAPLVRTP